MPHAYTEDQLVEQPAVQLFAELGWATISASEEVFGAGGTLGRDTKGETVLMPRLRNALEKLNPALPPEGITVAVDELARDRSAMSMVAANREVYALLKDGVKVSVPDREQGGQKIARVRVVDWENPAANDFLLVSQMSITGTLYTRRPDLVGFINGLPMVVVEFKKPGVPARAAFDDNLTCYKADIRIERPVHDTGKFTFYRAGTVEGNKAGIVVSDNTGLLRAVFKPERLHEQALYSRPVTRPGGTGLSAQSDQTFRTVAGLEHDEANFVTINLRLVSPAEEPRPLFPRSTPVPPPVERPTFKRN